MKKNLGVLLHISSLPEGKLDTCAYQWIDWLKVHHFNLWQILPLNIPQMGLSPYSSVSAYALNPALFNPVPEGLKIDQAWLDENLFWLKDFALFQVLKAHFYNKAWMDWPEEFRQRDKKTLKKFAKAHKDEIKTIYLQQYFFAQEWFQFRTYAKEAGIKLFGDMPLFVAQDSADVWAHQAFFMLDEEGQAQFVAGVPPDYFSETGQRWGNPQYNWPALEAEGFQWWIDRIAYQLKLFDLLRIDHFRGLEASWFIPASEETAIQGYWQKVPGEKLLNQLKKSLGDKLPLIAEDLGLITPEVDALRKAFNLPGMAILQFGFDGLPGNPHHPAAVSEDRFLYTGTHDNETLMGWWQGLAEDTRNWIYGQLVDLADEHEKNWPMPWLMLAVALKTQAQAFIVPVQDLMGLGNEARMNVPGTEEGNWQWQFKWADLDLIDLSYLSAWVKKNG